MIGCFVLAFVLLGSYGFYDDRFLPEGGLFPLLFLSSILGGIFYGLSSLF